MSVVQFLNYLQVQAEAAEFNEASGFVIEVVGGFGGCQLIGPFDKRTVDALSAIEVLQNEEDPEGVPNTYKVRLLFPPSFAVSR